MTTTTLMRRGHTETCEPIQRTDPLTGRRITQLTRGACEDYPLYYFIPTVTRDGGIMVFHRLCEGQLQYHKLELATGRITCLTSGDDPGALWRPWTRPPAVGPREHLAVLNDVTEELIYFERQHIRALHVRTLAEREAGQVPPGRHACSQTSISPDGRYLAYGHCDRKWWESYVGKDPVRSTARDARVELLDLVTGQSRPIYCANGWITHVTFLNDRRLIMSHPPTEQGILMFDIEDGWCMNIRPMTPDGRTTCHYHATERGVTYEANTYAEPVDRSRGVMGIFDHRTLKRREYHVTARITHIGWDPTGRLWFGEQLHEQPRIGRMLGYCPRLEPGVVNPFVPLTEPVITCGDQSRQLAHTHPMLMPDRRSILFNAGDPATGTNHPCLLDVADLVDVDSEKSLNLSH